MFSTLKAQFLSFNPFPHDTILEQTNSKAFADDKLNVTELIISTFDRVENIVGKGEIARYEQFLLFPQRFQTASFPEASKGVVLWKWVKLFFVLCKCFKFGLVWKRFPPNNILLADLYNQSAVSTVIVRH